jgi:hypothetical protein
VCPNCGQPAPGKFCAECGQSQGPLRITARELVAEIADELLQLDSKIARTLRPLFLRPGFLTREHCEGRRVRYVRPFRLFLGTSVAWFLLLSLATAVLPRDFRLQAGNASDPTAQLTAWAGHLPPAFAAHVHRLLKDGGPAAAERIWRAYLDFGPKVQLLATPIYALLLLLVFRDLRRTYAEHFVFALHFYAFYFALGCLPSLLLVAQATRVSMWAGFITGTVSWVYLFFALRTVYARSNVSTLWRTVVMVALNALVQAGLNGLVILGAILLA